MDTGHYTNASDDRFATGCCSPVISVWCEMHLTFNIQRQSMLIFNFNDYFLAYTVCQHCAMSAMSAKWHSFRHLFWSLYLLDRLNFNLLNMTLNVMIYKQPNITKNTSLHCRRHACDSRWCKTKCLSWWISIASLCNIDRPKKTNKPKHEKVIII